jgi:hypothetical protein
VEKPLFEEQQITITKEMTSSWNVFIAIPCYDQLISETTFMSVLKTIMFFKVHGIDFAISTISDSLISRARNNVSAKFLANKQFTHMMFIDADIGFEATDLVKMLWHSTFPEKEIVTGSYPIKDINWKKVENNVKKGVSHDKLLERSIRFVVNPVKSDGNQKFHKLKVDNGCIEIFDAGTGFMLIKREAFLKLIEKYPHLRYNDDTGSLSEQEKEWTYAFFNSYVDPHGHRFLSEDYGFCRYWQDIGGKIWVDPAIELLHLGRMKYKGMMSQFLSEIATVEKENVEITVENETTDDEPNP